VAVQRSVEEVEALKARVHERLPEIDRAIFDAHRMMLEDLGFLGKIETLIQEGYAAETALKKVVEGYVEALGRVPANTYAIARPISATSVSACCVISWGWKKKNGRAGEPDSRGRGIDSLRPVPGRSHPAQGGCHGQRRGDRARFDPS